MRPKQILPLWVRVDQAVMAMKRYSTLPRSLELEPHHKIQLIIIPKIQLIIIPRIPPLEGSYPSKGNTVNVFFCWQGMKLVLSWFGFLELSYWYFSISQLEKFSISHTSTVISLVNSFFQNQINTDTSK